MIIALQHRKPQPILDELLHAFDGSMPVADSNEVIVGNCWLMERGPKLVVLDVITEPEALVKWIDLGYNVLIINELPDLDEDWLADNMLVVTDTPGAYPCSVLVSDDLADSIERLVVS